MTNSPTYRAAFASFVAEQLAEQLDEHGACDSDLECPCCGDVGAVPDAAGYYTDGQCLVCGCPGWVSIDLDNTAWINSGDEPCKVGHD